MGGDGVNDAGPMREIKALVLFWFMFYGGVGLIKRALSRKYRGRVGLHRGLGFMVGY